MKQDFIPSKKYPGLIRYKPKLYKYSLGGDIASGAALGSTVGSIIPGVGTAIGGVVGGIGGLVKGLVSKNKDKQLQEQTEKLISMQNRINMANQEVAEFQMANPGYKYGGYPVVEDFKGATHEDGGIPIGEGGSPIAKSKMRAIGVVEKGETSWKNYIFSNSIPYKSKK